MIDGGHQGDHRRGDLHGRCDKLEIKADVGAARAGLMELDRDDVRAGDQL